MAYYEIMIVVLIVALLFLVAVFFYSLGVTKEQLKSKEARLADSENRFDIQLTAYKRGWEESKQLYYTDVVQVKVEEQQRMQELINKENEDGYDPVTADLLMAFGVTRAGQLPKSVREQYNITDENKTLEDALGE